MKSQIIVTVGREHGSAGHEIARMIAEQLQIRLYDRQFVENSDEISGYSMETACKADEKPVNPFLSRRIGDFSNSIEENVAEKTFEFLRRKADSGDSFVVVGRCADYILRDNPNVIRIFITSEYHEKILRIMETNQVSDSKAADIIRKTDRQRKAYHNYYCDTKWGDSRRYDLLVNSSKLGISGTVAALLYYIRIFMAK